MKFKAMIVALGCAMGLSAPALAQNKSIDTVKRSSQWVVDFDDSSCQVLAEFGTPQDRYVLRFTRYSQGDSTDVVVTGGRLETKRAWVKTSLDFGLGGRPAERQAAGIVNAKLPGVMLIGVRLDGWSGEGEAPAVTPAQEAAITGVTVRMEGRKPFRLEFGPLDRPMKIMRVCLNNLIQSWGYDPAVVQGLREKAKPANNPGSWVTDDDYPPGPMSKGHNGLLRFRLDLDESGKITGCHILDRTDPDDFSTVTCGLLTKRGRFKPAIDANGKPVRAFFLGTFTWKAGM